MRPPSKKRSAASDAAASGQGQAPEAKKKKSGARQIGELVATLLIALSCAFLCQAILVKPYKIPSGSMEPTLQIGQRVLVWRLGHQLGSDPKIGDIVVFHPPVSADSMKCGVGGQGLNPVDSRPYPFPCSQSVDKESSEVFIKRLVAVGGDRISIRDGHLIRNGQPEADSYINPCQPGDVGCSFTGTITVPKGYYFMMGDNRGESDDSRFWGPVPRAWIIGTTFATYWPLTRIKFY